MAKTKQQKQEILQSYEKALKEAKAIYLASTQLDANQTSDMKKRLTSDNAKYSVIKNTLFNIATKNVFGEDLNLKGQTSVVVCFDDVVAPAKELAELKKQEKAEYVLCILDGKVLEPSKIKELANLESKEVLLGKLMYLVNYPTM